MYISYLSVFEEKQNEYQLGTDTVVKVWFAGLSF